MLIVKEKIDIGEIKRIAQETFGTVVKAVVDVEKCIMAIGSELHADEEAELLAMGSKQENLWGINIYPDAEDEDFIEFDSLINLRPSQGNRSRGVDDPALRKRIVDIVYNLIAR
uniref:Uncharacterized protein n=1 Tax=candidate division WOR-3 bacterium TaxID=2052148 RepID=A0A7C6EI05_UNCW3